MNNSPRQNLIKNFASLILALGTLVSAPALAAADVVDPTNGLTLYTGVTATAPAIDDFEGAPPFLLDNSSIDVGLSGILGATDSTGDGASPATTMDLVNIAGGPVSILFDLGSVKNVTQEVVWNFSQPGFLEFGAQHLEVSAGLSPTSLSTPTTVVLTQAAFTDNIADTGVPSQELNLNLGNVQYIQFTLDDAYATPAQQMAAGGDAAGLNEVHFEGAIPEPSTWAMMLAGVAFLGFLVRRKSAKFEL